jgi:hypothetical protein
MQLNRQQRQKPQNERGIWVTDACDKCGQLSGSVRWTRKDEPGEWVLSSLPRWNCGRCTNVKLEGLFRVRHKARR